MKHKLLRRALALLLTLCMTLTLLPAALAVSGTYGGLDWTLADGTLTISGRGKLSTWLSINSAENPNANASVRTIVIEEGITELTGGALQGMSAAETVYLPSTVTTAYAASLPPSLRAIHVAADNPVYRSVDGVLFQWEELVLYPGGRTDAAYTVPEGVFTIGRNAFSGNPYLTDLTLPDSLTSIGDSAFYPCPSLKQVHFGTGLTHIGYGSFRECTSLTGITLPASLETIDQRAFQNCTALNSVTFGGDPWSIGSDAFYGCSALKEVALPRITTVEQNTFAGTGLEQVYIPDSVSYIGSNAFGADLELVDYGGTEAQWAAITIQAVEYSNPTNTSLLNAHKRYNQTGLSAEPAPQTPKAVIPAGVADYGYLNDEQTVAWYFRDGVLTITGQGAIPSYSDDLPKEWTRCRDEPFWGYKALIIEEGITSIGSFAFASKRFSFGTIQLPSTLQSIGNFAFNGVGGCKSLVLYGKTIGTSAFASMVDLEQVVLPTDLIKISASAFHTCPNLKRITIPDSVTFIGTKAFYSTGLTDVYYCGSESQWNAINNRKSFSYYDPPTVHFDSLPFCDVYPGQWFHPYVKDLVEIGFIKGMTATSYQPDGLLTYGQTLKMITLAVGEGEQAPLPGQNWASGYLQLARDRGWVTGTVELNSSISRVELCRMVAAALGLTAQSTQSPFTDTNDPAVLALYEAGIINGMTATTFDPEGSLTRAHIAKIVWFLLNG